MTKHFKVVIEHEPTGGFSAFVPILPGCASQGETLEEALTNIKEAIHLFIESLQEDGLPLPSSNAEVLIKEVAVNV